MIELALVALLKASPAVAALVGDRVYPSRLPQGSAYPNVVYQRVSGPRVSHLLGPSKLAHPRVQVDCRSTLYGEAKALGEAARLALDGYPVQQGGARLVAGVRVQGVHLVDDEDMEDAPVHADDVPVFRVRQDYVCWYEEV